jgi:hypothetical protein
MLMARGSSFRCRRGAKATRPEPRKNRNHVNLHDCYYLEQKLQWYHCPDGPARQVWPNLLKLEELTLQIGVLAGPNMHDLLVH